MLLINYLHFTFLLLPASSKHPHSFKHYYDLISNRYHSLSFLLLFINQSILMKLAILTKLNLHWVILLFIHLQLILKVFLLPFPYYYHLHNSILIVCVYLVNLSLEYYLKSH